MGKQIIAKNPNATAIYRFTGKDIFLKCNNKQYVAQLVEQIKKKGGSVEIGRTWLKADIFGEANNIILSGKELVLDKSTDTEIEEYLYDFFFTTLEKAQFKCEGKSI